MENKIQISNGPSREELFDGLRLFAEKREVAFLIENNDGKQISLPFIMQSIQAEDGSGNSWNIQMNLHLKSLGENSMMTPIILRKEFFGNPIKNAIVVKAYYSTKTRRGTITVGNDEHKSMHRIVVHNEIANDNTVQKIVNKEIGNVNIINWQIESEINYHCFVMNSEFQQAQRDTIIKVFYLKTK